MRTAAACLLVCLVLAAPAAAQWTYSAGIAPPPSSAPALPAQLTLASGGRAIPRAFFGLSMEYKELGTFERAGAVFDRAIALIRPRDGQPMMLRIGGKSADHVWWKTATSRPPQWVTKIGDTWLGKLARLVGRDDLRVLLDLNLAVHSASLESAFATATASALPVGGLAGLEIGNEPDLYWRQPSLERQQAAATDPSVPPHWTSDYAPVDYRRDYTAYARALKRTLPGIPLIAPEIISAKAPWLDAVDRLGSLAPSAIAVHRYASSSCWPIDSQFHPTIPLMLREAATAGLAGTVAPSRELCAYAANGAVAHGDELGQLRRQRRRGRFLRHRPVGARRAVRDDPGRRRPRQLAPAPRHQERALSGQPGFDQAATGALRPCPVRRHDARAGDVAGTPA